MEQMTTFRSPQMLRRYSDGGLRIVTYDDIKEGDSVVFKNEKWQEETRMVSEIKEKRPSTGDFNGFKVPTSYLIL